MSDPRKKYGVNRSAEEAGALVVIDDCEFTVRSTLGVNRDYRYALGQAFNRNRERMNALEPAKQFALHEDLTIEAFAEACVLDWKNVTNGNGEPLEFNRENCVALLRDCPDVWDRLKEAALDATRFALTKEDGEQLGKS